MWRTQRRFLSTRARSSLQERLKLGDEVREAMYGRERKAVVALESTIVSHGMPYPENLDMARSVERTVRENGAIPATICIANGKLCVGLEDEELGQLAEAGSAARKCTTRDMASALTDKALGATTVASTMRIAHAANIQVFVTGGIGGVHRFSEQTMDISADLIELSRTPVAVICAGIKSILDIPRSLEFLETYSVPVVGYGTDQFPAFFTQDSGHKVQMRRDSPMETAKLIRESAALGLPNGMVISVPNPKPVDQELIDGAINLGLEEVMRDNIKGQAVTPYLLKRLNEITNGASLGSNIDLVHHNAVVGSKIACALQQLNDANVSSDSTNETSGDGKFSPIGHQWSKSPAEKRILVAGGLVLDLVSSSAKPIVRDTTNIGTVSQYPGGVGRNITETLYRLEQSPLLVSTVGDDISGATLLKNLSDLNLDTSGVTQSTSVRTAVASVVMAPDGEFDVGVADMDALDTIDTTKVPTSTLRQARLVISDGNLPPSSLRDILERSHLLGISTWFEPTSIQKALRIVEADALRFLTYMSPNASELSAISKALESNNVGASDERLALPIELPAKVTDFDLGDVEKLTRDLMTVLLAAASESTEEKHIFVTLGGRGVLVGSINSDHQAIKEAATSSNVSVDLWGQGYVGNKPISFAHLPGSSISITNAIGAGDTMVGGTVYGLLQGNNVYRSCHLGMTAAKMSLTSATAIHSELSPSRITTK